MGWKRLPSKMPSTEVYLSVSWVISGVSGLTELSKRKKKYNSKHPIFRNTWSSVLHVFSRFIVSLLYRSYSLSLSCFSFSFPNFYNQSFIMNFNLKIKNRWANWKGQKINRKEKENVKLKQTLSKPIAKRHYTFQLFQISSVSHQNTRKTLKKKRKS